MTEELKFLIKYVIRIDQKTGWIGIVTIVAIRVLIHAPHMNFSVVTLGLSPSLGGLGQEENPAPETPYLL